MSELYTTLRLLRMHNACKEGYEKCRRSLGSGWGQDAPIPLSRIVASNGIEDTLWCLRALSNDSPTRFLEYSTKPDEAPDA